jgi:hypothetical protein
MTRESASNRTEVELLPEAWSHFERAVDVVVKSGPQHKIANSSANMRKSDKANEKREPSPNASERGK